MPEATQKDPREVNLKKVRLSFPTLIEKKATIAGGKKKFSANFIIDPNTPEGKANMARCQQAMAAAEEREFKKTGVIKEIDDPKRVCLRKGEKFKNSEDEIYDGYAGMVGLATKADKRPKLFDRKKEMVERHDDIEEAFQAGYYCDAIVSFYCTSKKEQGGKGVFATVKAIRSHQEGETFGAGNTSSADDFDDLEANDGFDGAGEGDDFLG